MQLAHRVALNGVQLDEVDNRIIIKGIEEAAGKEVISAVSPAFGCGQRVTNRRRDTLDLTVKFSLNLRTTELQERSEVFEAVNKWAVNGGYLTINYKPNRRLYVVCAQCPGAGDQYARTTVYTITFRAYSIPYWEEETPRTAATGTSTNTSCSLEVGGSAETVADITLYNRSGMSINNVTINAAGNVMTFESLGMGANETLTISHTADGLVRIRVGSRSAMAKRTASSANDLRVMPGQRAFSFRADRACQMSVSVRGRFS